MLNTVLTKGQVLLIESLSGEVETQLHCSVFTEDRHNYTASFINEIPRHVLNDIILKTLQSILTFNRNINADFRNSKTYL